MKNIDNFYFSRIVLKKSIPIFFAFFLSIILATLAMYRPLDGKESNDTNMYYTHYLCIDNINNISDCEDKIGNSFDSLYVLSVKIYAQLFGSDGFSFFIFSLAFLYTFSLFMFVGQFSPLIFFSFLFLLTDFRFWEGFVNVLRHGLSLSVFLLCCTLGYGRSKIFALRFFCLLAHKSSLVLCLAASKSKYSFKLIVTFFLVSFFILFNYDLLLSLTIFDSSNKLFFYSKDFNDLSYSGAGIPVHYYIILALSLFVYIKTDNEIFIYSTNILLLLVCSAIVLSPINLGYRMSMFMTPFIALNFSVALAYFKNILCGCNKLTFFLLDIVAYIFIFLLAINNFDKILYHF